MKIFRENSDVTIKLWPFEVAKLAREQRDVEASYRHAADHLPSGFPQNGRISVGLFPESATSRLAQIVIEKDKIVVKPPFLQARLDKHGNLDVRVSDTFLFDDPTIENGEIKVTADGINTEDYGMMNRMSIGRVSLIRLNTH